MDEKNEDLKMRGAVHPLEYGANIPLGGYQVEHSGPVQSAQGRMRHGSQLFYQLLQEMAETHDRKSHDYASNENPFGNYLFAGEVARMFSHSSSDAGFVGRLAEKIYRIAMLESFGKIPQNESIEDTEKDVAVIVLLWITSRRELRAKKKRESEDINIRTKTQEEVAKFGQMQAERKNVEISNIAQECMKLDLSELRQVRLLSKHLHELRTKEVKE